MPITKGLGFTMSAVWGLEVGALLAKLNNKLETKILVVEPSSSGRQMLAIRLRSAGYAQITGVDDIKDAVELLEADRIDWVITYLGSDAQYNGMNLLRLCSTEPMLYNTRVSFLLDEMEYAVLPTAYEMGLLSHGLRAFTKDGVDSFVENIDAAINRFNAHLPSIAAGYFREALKERKDYENLIALERNMVAAFPGHANWVFNLGLAYFESENIDLGVSAFHQALFLDEGLRPQIDKAVHEYLGEDCLEEPSGDRRLNLFGLDTCVLVDPDKSVQMAVQTMLAEAGCEQIHVFSDGLEASAWLEVNPTPTLIIHEWKLPKISGPAFLQRCRHLGHYDVPMIIYSSLVREEDQALLKEMGVAALITKPLDAKKFLKKLVTVICQERVPSEASALERRLRLLLQAGKMAEAQTYLGEFMARSDIKPPRKEQLRAEFAYHEGRFLEARDAASEALKKGGESLYLMNLLGKCMMKLRDFRSALACFQKAQDMSPANIERLCSISEVHGELGEAEQARKSMDQALQIDCDSRLIQEVDLKNAITIGDLDHARHLMAQIESIENIISYMNNRAVALAQCGLVDEGINLYRRAIKSQPESRPEFKPLILYNLGLAYARASELPEAKITLEKVIELGPSKVRLKAKSLLSRVTKAIASGLPLETSLTGAAPRAGTETVATAAVPSQALEDAAGQTPAEDAVDEQTSRNTEIARALGIKKGDACLYRIFINCHDINTLPRMLLRSATPFQPREAISRGDTFGADKTLKNQAG